MPERLIRPGTNHGIQSGPDDRVPDISQLGTTLLKLRQPTTEAAPRQQVAEHQAEIRRVAEMANTVERALTTLEARLRMAADRMTYDALLHNQADLQRYRGELESLRVEHERAIERLTGRTGL